MGELIDVLLPTYNGEKYVKEQIESILNQTYKNIRLIISDDCSTDNTVQIVKEYEEKDNRVKVIVQEENLGVIKNIEFLLNQVQADFYMLSDQDDFWMPQKIEKTFEKLKEKNADLVFGDLEVVDEKLNKIHSSFNDFMLLSRKIEKYINTDRLNYLYNCITGCTILSKKELLSKILPLPKSSKYVLHDHWIGLVASLNGKVAYIQETYIKYRQHGNNEVGAQKVTHSMEHMNDVRNHFINVKLGLFETYVQNNEMFSADVQTLNKEALEYFKRLQNKKNFNFSGWKIFHKLYKTETFMYYIENFLILNLPFIGNILFNIRYAVLKLLKRR